MVKKNVHNRFFLWSIVFVSFVLAVLDMMFLRDVMKDYIFGDNDVIKASSIALLLASAANVTALLWGKEKGERKTGRPFLIGWIFLGFAYAVIRSVSFVNNVVFDGDWSFDAIIREAVPVIILTISYVGTGTMLQWAGAQLWDNDIVNYLRSKEEFKREHTMIANNYASITAMIKSLREYDSNYDCLENQYIKHLDKIRKNEKSTMSLIVAKTIAKFPEITPEYANQVMDEVLAERDSTNERAHTK